MSELSRREASILTAAATLLAPGEAGAADPKATMTIKPLKILLDNGRYFEACRWHNDRLWLVDSRARTLLRMADDGTAEVVCRLEGVPAGLGFLVHRRVRYGAGALACPPCGGGGPPMTAECGGCERRER